MQGLEAGTSFFIPYSQGGYKVKKRNVMLAAALTALLSAIGAAVLAGCSGNSPSDPPVVTTAALAAAISDAGAAKTGVVVNATAANVLVGTQWVTQAELDALDAAIAAAQAVADNAAATQAQVDAAVTALTTATAMFTAAKKDGAGNNDPTVNKAALNTAIDAAKAAKTGVALDTDAANVSEGTTWATQAEVDALDAAIAATQAVADNAAATQAQVDAAVTALTTATGTFNAAKKDGTNAQLAADAFTTAHAATVNLDVATVADANKAAVNAALAAYNALTEAAKALLPGDTLAKLQALAAKLNVPLGTVTDITLDFKDGGDLLAPAPNLTISKGAAETLTVSAAAGLTDIRWSLNGVDLPDPRGAAQSITLAAANYPAGSYLLGLAAQKGDVVYSTELTFTVVD
jgi:hypothetical protein